MTCVVDCRLIVDSPASGAWNMAVDEALLADAADNGVATLRFYGWSEPTLSLGYFQSYEDRYSHPASRQCAVVRRQTGGGAILHDRELTYSLALPPGHRLASRSEQLYTAVHQAFIAALLPFIATNSAPSTLRRRGQDSKLRPDEEPFLCFQRRACGDVVAVPSPGLFAAALQVNRSDQGEVKILGSAQRRHRGVILQHGSLLLERSPAAPELAGLRDLTGVAICIAELVENLADRLSEILGVRYSRPGISSDLKSLESNVEVLTNTKYGAQSWTKRR